MSTFPRTRLSTASVRVVWPLLAAISLGWTPPVSAAVVLSDNIPANVSGWEDGEATDGAVLYTSSFKTGTGPGTYTLTSVTATLFRESTAGSAVLSVYTNDPASGFPWGAPTYTHTNESLGRVALMTTSTPYGGDYTNMVFTPPPATSLTPSTVYWVVLKAIPGSGGVNMVWGFDPAEPPTGTPVSTFQATSGSYSTVTGLWATTQENAGLGTFADPFLMRVEADAPAVPLPPAVLLFGSALAGLAWRRRGAVG